MANSKKNGRNFLSSRSAPLFARLSHLRLPHSFVPSPLSESLERAFPDTVSFHTYPVNPAYESATFWIRSPEWTFLHTLWIRNRADANSGYFFIRWHNKIELSSLLWILYSRWQPRSQVLRRQSKTQISRALRRRLFCNIPRGVLGTRTNPDTWRIPVKGQMPFEYCYMWTWRFLNRERKSCGFKNIRIRVDRAWIILTLFFF